MSHSRRNCLSVFVGRLPLSLTKEQLHELFKGYGPINDCYLATAKDYQKHTYGFVRFLQLEHARKAVKEMDGWPVFGQKINVEISDDTRSLLSEKGISLTAGADKQASKSDMDNLDRLANCINTLNAFRNKDDQIDGEEILDLVNKEDNSLIGHFQPESPPIQLNLAQIDEIVKQKRESELTQRQTLARR